MERKIQLKPELRMPKGLTNQVYMSLAQKILSKYGIGRRKNQNSKLIFRQIKMLFGAEPDLESSTRPGNYKNYYSNVYKSVFNLTTQTINTSYSKKHKELLIPFYILKDTKWSNNYSKEIQLSNKEVLKLIYSNNYAGEPIYRPGEGQIGDIGFTKANIPIQNIYQQILKKYSNNLEKNHTSNVELSFLNTYQKVQGEKEKAAADRNEQQHSLVTEGNSGSAMPVLPEPIVTLLKSKIIEKKQQTIAESQINSKNNLNPFSNNSYRHSADLFYNKSPLRQLIDKAYTYKWQSINSEITDQKADRALNYIEFKAQLEAADNKDTAAQSEKKVKTLINALKADKGKMPVDIKEDFLQSEIILHTSMKKEGLKLKNLKVLRSNSLQEDRRIFKINELSRGNFEKDMYSQNLGELIPARGIKDGNIATEFRTAEKEELIGLTDKPQDRSLVFYRPQKNETAEKRNVEPKDVLKSEKEVYAKVTRSSKPRNDFSDIGAEEVNMLAERVSKILEKRMTIQKDRRGMR